MNAGRIGRRRSRRDVKDQVVCGEGIGVGASVVRVHIVDRVLKNRDGTLLSGKEVVVRRDRQVSPPKNDLTVASS